MSYFANLIAEIGTTNLLLIVVVLILVVALILLIVLVRRREIKAQDFFANLEKQQEHSERMVRDEFARNRQEAAGSARQALRKAEYHRRPGLSRQAAHQNHGQRRHPEEGSEHASGPPPRLGLLIR